MGEGRGMGMGGREIRPEGPDAALPLYLEPCSNWC